MSVFWIPSLIASTSTDIKIMNGITHVLLWPSVLNITFALLLINYWTGAERCLKLLKS